MPQTSEVTVIIPNYNGKRLLEKCIETLEQQSCRGFKLLIVDNGSTDGSDKLKSDILDLEMILLRENTGFCGAVNIGLAHTKTPYVILLNNDIEADSYFVEALLTGIRKSDRIFSCSAQMIDYQRRDVIDNAGDLYTIFGWAIARGRGKATGFFAKESPIFSSCGGAAIYRMDIIKEIGSLDERHFAYLEDVDLGYRARIYGYQNYYMPEAKVYHVGSATTGSRYNERKVFLAARNSVYLFYKNMPFLQLFLNAPFLLLGILIKYLFFVRRGLAGDYWRGVKEGVLTCRSCRKVPFCISNIWYYIRIELDLFLNVMRLILGD